MGNAAPSAASDAATRFDQLREDQYRRWQAGDRVPAEHYVAELPATATEDALVLIWAEVRLRTARGEAPLLVEFQDRFPEHADALARQFELELLMGSLAGATLTQAPPPPGPAGHWPAPPGYELLGELGRGAMGVVYKARQVALNRTVALKVLRGGDIGDADRGARFRQEAELAGRLHHPAIAQVFEYGIHAGRAFIVMEFVDGRTLAAADRPQPALAAAGQVEALATAVQFAHSNGVVHRDLKPANVLIGRDGQPKIVDFGLAKELESSSAWTATGVILGTPAYMAPEQAAGRVADLGPATDIWALGAILYDLLTGRPPFHGPSPAATLQQVLTAEPAAPTRVRPETPRDLETICLKCLHKDPGRRYESAAALADDLRRFRAGESIRARPVRAPERAWRWCRRNPGWAAMASSAVLLLAVIAGGGVWYSVRLADALEKSDRARAESDARFWENQIAGARLIRQGNGLDARRNALALLQAAAATRVSPDLRNEFVAALALPDVSVARQFNGWPADAVAISFSADFTRYVRADATSVLTIRRTEDDVEVGRIEVAVAVRPKVVGGKPAKVWMGPDGRTVVALVGVPGERSFRVGVWTEGPAGFVAVGERRGFDPGTAVAFRPAGERAAVLNPGDGKLHVLDLARGFVGEPVELGGGFNLSGIAYHPTRDRVAVAGHNRVRVIDPGAGQETAAIDIPESQWVNSVAWHPTAETVLVGWADPRGTRLGAWDLAGPTGPTALATYDGHADKGAFGAFDPAGRLVASNDWSDVVRLFDAGSGLPLFHAATSTSQGIRFSPDGDRLGPGIANREVRLFRVAPSPVFRTLGRADSVDTRVLARVSPDGRLLAVGNEKELRFWDLDTTKLVGARPGPELPFDFGADGVLLVSRGPEFGRLEVAQDPVAGAVTVGRFRALLSKFWTTTCYAATRRVVVSSDQHGTWVAFPNAFVPYGLRVELPHADARHNVVSSDGRWVVTCSHFPTPGDPASVKVWDEKQLRRPGRARPAAQLAVGHAAHAAFSPDGRWLATATLLGGCRLWAVGTWEPGPEVGGNFPLFTPDGRFVVTHTGSGELTMSEADTGREIVRLAAPVRTRVYPLCFSPDGGRLVVWGRETNTLHVWDLAELRALLWGGGLDW
jgi:WD40 repeat protein/tRNA A-37 threonylcarbamoyl transferase component Bud32